MTDASPDALPAGTQRVTPHLVCKGAAEAIDDPTVVNTQAMAKRAVSPGTGDRARIGTSRPGIMPPRLPRIADRWHNVGAGGASPA